MSGPIVRKYGVPNWDEIFGKKKEPPDDEADSKAERKEATTEKADGSKQEKKTP